MRNLSKSSAVSSLRKYRQQKFGRIISHYKVETVSSVKQRRFLNKSYSIPNQLGSEFS